MGVIGSLPQFPRDEDALSKVMFPHLNEYGSLINVIHMACSTKGKMVIEASVAIKFIIELMGSSLKVESERRLGTKSGGMITRKYLDVCKEIQRAFKAAATNKCTGIIESIFDHDSYTPFHFSVKRCPKTCLLYTSDAADE